MKSRLDQIENKLNQKSIPSDKNLQASYFSKLWENCQEFSNMLQKSTKVFLFSCFYPNYLNS